MKKSGPISVTYKSAAELREARAAAQIFTRTHLRELAGEIDKHSDNSLAAAGSRLEELHVLCRKFCGSKMRDCALGMINAELRAQAIATLPAPLDVDQLAQEIRRVDGSHSLGAGALAEALMPFLAKVGHRSSVISTRDLREAFEEGYAAPSTYNDSDLGSVEESWAESEARALHDAANALAVAK